MAFSVTLRRSDDDVSWGFRLIGGTDFEMPLTVIKRALASHSIITYKTNDKLVNNRYARTLEGQFFVGFVQPSSPAEKAGLQNGDALVIINDVPTSGLTHDGAYEVIKTSDLELNLKIRRGVYDAVLDDQEPIYEELEYDQQLDYFDPTSNDPSEVFRPITLPCVTPAGTTTEITSRSQTASPFAIPTKPYRPFSTEPVEIPPLEAPIILNPSFHDEFKALTEDFMPKTRFKLPISEQYDPDGKGKKKIIETIKETSLVETFERDNRVEEFTIKVKEETVLNKALDATDTCDYSEKYKDEYVQVNVDVIQDAASVVVQESINKAVSVAEEIKQEMLVTNVIDTATHLSSNLSQTAEKVSEVSEESKVCVAEKIKEFESVAQRSEEKTDLQRESNVKIVSDQRKELSTIDKIKNESVSNESAKTVSKDNVINKQSSDINTSNIQTKEFETKTETQKEILNQKNVNKSYNDTNMTNTKTTSQTSAAKSTAEQRSFVIGLQTIPKIRGHVHSSYHYNLLLKTFFLHLTDVMVALSRFILTEPAIAITDDQINAQNIVHQQQHQQQQEVNDRKETVEEQIETIQKISESITNANSYQNENVVREHNVKVSDVVKKEALEREKTENNILEASKTVEDGRLSGCKMSQLTEHKTEDLTQKMGAVISEFQNKACLDEVTESMEVRTEKQFTERSEVTTEENVKESQETSTEGKQYYRAVVESHTYTNKDAILKEQSETSSLQSVDATNIETTNIQMSAEAATQVVEACEQTSSIKEDVISSQEVIECKENVSTEVCNKIDTQTIDAHERTDIDILENNLSNNVDVIKAEVETKLQPMEPQIALTYESTEINQQFNIKQEFTATSETTETTEQVASFVAKKSKNFVEETKFETQEVSSEVFLDKTELNFDQNLIQTIQESVITQETEISSEMAKKRADLRKLTFKEPKISKSSSNSSFPSSISTPTPASVPPTPITDEYIFRLQCEIPKDLPYIPNDSEFSPEDHEDLNIVKKKLIPHIDTDIEQMVYDVPLPTPPSSKTGSLSGSPKTSSRRSSKEEIKEIERKSSLLTSAIDETIKNIEQYKEQAGITNNGVDTTPLRKPSIEIAKRNSITDEQANAEQKQEKIQMEKDWAKVVGELKVNGKNSSNISDSMTTQTNVNSVAELRENITQMPSESVIKSSTETSSQFQSVNMQTEQKSKQIESTNVIESFESTKATETVQSCPVRKDSVPGFRSVQFNPLVTEEVFESKAEKTSKIDTKISENIEKSTREAEVVESVEVKTDIQAPVAGYRPVKFDPEEISKYIQNEEIIRQQQQNGFKSVHLNIASRTEKSIRNEVSGSKQGIIDSLEEAIVDPNIAKELGKPGMTEEKIAELISGESEMLREAHVMGLSRVIASHMTRPDDNSSVDFKKIKPTIDRLKDSEVIKALNEEVVKDKVEKKEERRWTTFLQKPQRPIPKTTFGKHGWTNVEVRPEDRYQVKIVINRRPKPDPNNSELGKDFNTGLLPWEERAVNEPPPPPVVPEDPILIPEEEVEFVEAIDPMPESAVPDLEETGIILPEPKSSEEVKPEEQIPETETEDPKNPEIDQEQAKEETEGIITEDMDKNQTAEQLMLNVQNMVDPNATLEQQLEQMRMQLSALAQLPTVIQQTLELVTKQLTQITHQQQLEQMRLQLSALAQLPTVIQQTLELVTKQLTQITHQDSTKSEAKIDNGPVDEIVVQEDTEQKATENEVEVKPEELVQEELAVKEDGVLYTEQKGTAVVPMEVQNGTEIDRSKECAMLEQRRIEMQKKEVMEQMQLEFESRQVKNHPTPRVGKPKPAFGPLVPQERPLVLPGGRKWRTPKDAYNEQVFTDMLAAQAEIIMGKAKGINFMKYEKPPVSLDHLKDSDTYKLIHNMEGAVRRVDMLRPAIAECDYREKCRSMTPLPNMIPREAHPDIPQQVQP